jgi:Flp pilus assembly protein protease CpaA
MELLTIPLHFAVMIQDIRTRAISGQIILSLFIIQLLLSVTSTISFSNILINELLLFLQLYLMIFIIKVKKGPQEQVIDNYFGKGDVWLLIISGLAFSNLQYFQFYFIALLLGLSWWFIFKLIIRFNISQTQQATSIPFAAILSFCFIVILSVKQISGVDLLSVLTW